MRSGFVAVRAAEKEEAAAVEVTEAAEEPEAAPVVVEAEAEAAAAAPAAAATTAADEVEYTLSGPEPKKFTVAEGQIVDILTASTPFATRLTSGAICEGWRPTLVEGTPAEGEYSIGGFGGRYLKETSDVSKFNRPAQPITMYEFEVRAVQVEHIRLTPRVEKHLAFQLLERTFFEK